MPRLWLLGWWVCERSGSGCGMLASVRFGRLAGDDLVVVPVLGPSNESRSSSVSSRCSTSSPARRVSSVSRSTADEAGPGAQSSRWPSRCAAIPAAGAKCGADGVPGAGEPSGWAVRQAPAAVDEVSRRERQRREVGHLCLQSRPARVGDVAFDQGNGGWLAVCGQDGPALAEEFEGVGAIPAPEIDGEAGRGSCPLPGAQHRGQQRQAWAASLSGVVVSPARVVGTFHADTLLNPGLAPAAPRRLPLRRRISGVSQTGSSSAHRSSAGP